MRSICVPLALALVAACSSTTNNITNVSPTPDGGSEEAGIDASVGNDAEPASDASSDAAPEAEAGLVCTGKPVVEGPQENCYPAGPCTTPTCNGGTRYFCRQGASTMVYNGHPSGLTCITSDVDSIGQKRATCCEAACVKTSFIGCAPAKSYSCPAGMMPPGNCTARGATFDPDATATDQPSGENWCCQ